jgi:peptide/nickel transport system substrate-binding protein
MLNDAREFFRRLFAKGGAARSPLHLAQRQVMAIRGSRAIPSLAQWRELPRYLTTTEKRLFGGAIAVLVIAGLLLGYKILSNNQTRVPAVGGSYTEGLIGTPQFLNPLYAVTSDTDTDLTRLIFSGLMRYSTVSGTMVTDLAESYTISPDQKTYTFILRKNATWHDGEPVTASDVVFTIEAIQNPDYHSPLSVSFSGVTVVATDDNTLSFTLSEPFSPFLSTLTVGILPAHIWQDIAPSSALLAHVNRTPIGSGPYMFKKNTQDQKGTLRDLSLARYPKFYNQPPYISELHFKFYNDAASLSEALKNRNVEGAGFVPTATVNALADTNLQILSAKLSQFTALFLNDAHTSLLADSNIRKALNLATDRAAIQTVVNNGAAITSPILPGMPGYDATTGATAYDLAAATVLLDTAGYKITEGSTVRAKSGVNLALTITTVDVPELTAVAAKIKEMWALAGVEITIIAVDPTTLQNNILKNRDYDILLTGELYGADQDPYAFWHSSQIAYPGLNLAQFSSRKADDAIEAARSTNDLAVHATSFTTLAGLIAAETPAIFLYQPEYAYVTSPRISGITLETITIPADRFSDINLWYMRTHKVFGKSTK